MGSKTKTRLKKCKDHLNNCPNFAAKKDRLADVLHQTLSERNSSTHPQEPKEDCIAAMSAAAGRATI